MTVWPEPKTRINPVKLWSALLLLAASMFLVPPAIAADPVVARVNGVEIKQSDLDFYYGR